MTQDAKAQVARRSDTVRQRPLRLALLANAVFSSLCGASSLLFAESAAVLMGVRVADLQSLGMELIAFAGLLFALVAFADLERRWARYAVMAVIALDVLWVLASVAVLFGAVQLTPAGKWMLAVSALVVGELAYLQLRGWLALRSTARPVSVAATAQRPLAG